MPRLVPNPDARLVARLAETERRLRVLETGVPVSITFQGPRSDLAEGVGPRVRIGLLSDDTYGVERWAEDGTREIAQWV